MKTIKMSSRIISANFQVLNMDQMVQLVGGEDAAVPSDPPKTDTGNGPTVNDPLILIRK